MSAAEKDVLADSGRRVGDPCEAIEAVFVYGPVTCVATSVAVVTDSEWGTTHVACAEHACRILPLSRRGRPVTAPVPKWLRDRADAVATTEGSDV